MILARRDTPGRGLPVDIEIDEGEAIAVMPQPVAIFALQRRAGGDGARPTLLRKRDLSADDIEPTLAMRIVSGTPPAMRAIFSGGCSRSPSTKRQPRVRASASPTTDFPLPLTPITTHAPAGGDGRHPVCRHPLLPVGRAAPVKQQHRHDDHTIDDLAACLRHLHHGEDRLQQSDEDDAGNRAEIGAAAAENRGAAEHDGRDRRQKIGSPIDCAAFDA